MKTVIAILLMCSASVANAGFWDVNELMRNMNSDSTVQRTAAITYIMGVHDAGNGVAFCSPDDITAGKMREVVRYFVDRMPETRTMHASVLAMSHGL